MQKVTIPFPALKARKPALILGPAERTVKLHRREKGLPPVGIPPKPQA